MIEPAVRLAVALPLLLLLLGGVLLAAKRGVIRLPGATLGTAPLRIVQIATVGPGTRLAVVDFDGERLLLGIARDRVTRLARQ